jgi:hypothetical protein
MIAYMLNFSIYSYNALDQLAWRNRVVARNVFRAVTCCFRRRVGERVVQGDTPCDPGRRSTACLCPERVWLHPLSELATALHRGNKKRVAS